MGAIRPTLAIHGSCVTRDFAELQGWSVKHYQARSSMCTKASPPVTFDVRLFADVPGDWNRRMIEWDLSRHAFDYSAADCLVLDFVDEREAVIEVGGALATCSFYFEQFAKDLASKGRMLDRTSAEFWEAFERGCRAFAEGITRPVVLHDAAWATHQRVDGALMPMDDPGWSERENQRLQRMTAIATEIFRPIGTLSAPSLAIADAGHKWGVAPFHYVPEYYAEVSSQLERIWDAFTQR